MSAIATLALTTMREAVRRKLVGLAALVGAAFLLLYGLAFHLATANPRNVVHSPSQLLAHQVEGLFLLMGLYAANLLVATIAILASIDALSGEIANGAIQTLVSKPLARWQLFIGKWLGFAALLTAFEALLLGGVMTIAYAATGYAAPHIPAGLALLWLEMLLLLTVTLLWGTRLSTLANGVLSLGLFGLAFLGGWMEQIGALTGHQGAVQAGIVASLIMPSEALWRRAAFEMQSPLMSALNLGPFVSISVPSGLMVAYAVVYALAALAVGLRSFATRDL
ncbi:MAG: ABC transporter permease [Terriglobales bacterium]